MKVLTITYEKYLKQFGIESSCDTYEEFFKTISNHYTNGKPIEEGASVEAMEHSILNACRIGSPEEKIPAGFDVVRVEEDLFLLPPKYKIILHMTTGETRIYYDSDHAFIFGAISKLEKIRSDLIKYIELYNSLEFIF